MKLQDYNEFVNEGKNDLSMNELLWAPSDMVPKQWNDFEGIDTMDMPSGKTSNQLFLSKIKNFNIICWASGNMYNFRQYPPFYFVDVKNKKVVKLDPKKKKKEAYDSGEYKYYPSSQIDNIYIKNGIFYYRLKDM